MGSGGGYLETKCVFLIVALRRHTQTKSLAPNRNGDAMNDLYSTYTELKGWGAEASNIDPVTFAYVLRAARMCGKLRILEIGFGDGSFMDWARGAGHEVTGLEILPECVAAARARGHDACLASDGLFAKVGFDVIVALDVLEHLDQPGFNDLTELAHRCLRPDGLIVARFPNGDSPFFGRYQYGDFTHRKPLSSRSLMQIMGPLGFELVHAFNPRPTPVKLRAKLKRRLGYLVRDLIEIVLGFAYFGCRTPMDPNIVVIIKAKPAEDSKCEAHDAG